MTEFVHEKSEPLTRKEARKINKYLRKWDKAFWLKMWRNKLNKSNTKARKHRFKTMYKARKQIAIAKRRRNFSTI